MKRHLTAAILICAIFALCLPFSASAQTATAAVPLRPEVRGLIDMGDISFNHTPGLTPNNSTANIDQVPGVFSAKIINVLWAQLQPDDATHFDFSAIDSALTNVQAYNQRNPATPLQAMLRVFAGPNAPNWVKQIGGDPVTVIHKAPEWTTGISETIGRFWSSDYRAAWRILQNALAAKYDSNPLISIVIATSCSSITDESYIIPLDQESRTNMLAAGFTDPQYQDCVQHVTDDYAGWTQTPLELTFNPYRRIATLPFQVDQSITVQAMIDCRAKLGIRCVLADECLGECESLPIYTDIFAQFKALGAPVSFEPYNPATLSADMAKADATIEQAIANDASSMEVWPLKDGFLSIPIDHLKQWALQFQSATR